MHELGAMADWVGLPGSRSVPSQESQGAPLHLVPPDRQWVDRLARARVVFFGDHHPDEHTKHAALSLLTRLSLRHSVPVVGLELVESRHQDALDRYVRGQLDDEALRERIGFADWGFPWRLYRGFFHLARFAGLPLLALDDRRLPDVTARDVHASALLARSLEARPGQCHFVLFGEDHLDPGGLACRTRQVLGMEPEEAPVICLGSPQGRWGVQVLGPGRWHWSVSAPSLRHWRSRQHRGVQGTPGPEGMRDLLHDLAQRLQVLPPDLTGYHAFPRGAHLLPFLARRQVDPAGAVASLQRLGCAVLDEPACWVLGDPTRPDLLAGAAVWLLSDAPRAEALDPGGQGPDWARVSALVELGRRLWLPFGSSRQAEALRETLWCGRPYPLAPTRAIRRGDRVARRLQDRALAGQPFQAAVRRLLGCA